MKQKVTYRNYNSSTDNFLYHTYVPMYRNLYIVFWNSKFVAGVYAEIIKAVIHVHAFQDLHLDQMDEHV